MRFSVIFPAVASAAPTQVAAWSVDEVQTSALLRVTEPVLVKGLVGGWDVAGKDLSHFAEFPFGGMRLMSTADSRPVVVSEYISDKSKGDSPPMIMIDQARSRPDDEELEVAKVLSGEADAPEQLDLWSSKRTASFAKKGSGMKMHRHGASWFGLASGAKKWFLCHPDREPTKLIKREPCEMQEKVETSSFKCKIVLQEQGDVLFVPENWYHATCNEADSVGFGGMTSLPAGTPPLQMASEAGELEVMRALLAEGADVNALSPDNSTALHRTAGAGNSAATQLLLDSGADAGLGKRRDEALPLHLAAHANSLATVQAILSKHPASATSKDARQDTPLHKLCDCGPDTPQTCAGPQDTQSAIQALMGAGANYFSKNRHKQTALHISAISGSTNCVPVLLSLGADVNGQDVFGLTPLVHAAFADHFDVGKQLVLAGADPWIKGLSGQTAGTYCKLGSKLCKWIAGGTTMPLDNGRVPEESEV